MGVLVLGYGWGMSITGDVESMCIQTLGLSVWSTGKSCWYWQGIMKDESIKLAVKPDNMIEQNDGKPSKSGKQLRYFHILFKFYFVGGTFSLVKFSIFV